MSDSNLPNVKDSLVARYSTEDGYIIRGENMTRIETFVDAAFAFAITMLVISLDSVPSTPAALFIAAKGIPAFLASGVLIGFIWYRHSQWSRRFGLQDRMTVLLSMCLVMLVLIFIYPLKLVFVGLFAWISGGYLSSAELTMSLTDLRHLFLFFAMGLFMLALIFYFLNKRVLTLADKLCLTPFEQWRTKTDSIAWLTTAVVATVAGLMAQVLPGLWVTLSGFIYAVLGLTHTVIHRYRNKNQPQWNSD